MAGLASDSRRRPVQLIDQSLLDLVLRAGVGRAVDGGSTLPDAMMKIFQQTGHEVHDKATGFTFKELNLLAAVDYVFAKPPR